MTSAHLAACPIGVVPIVWNNIDLPDLATSVEGIEVIDEIARLGFDGCQYGAGFATGPKLADQLAGRHLRLAEVYASIPCTEDGPVEGALSGVLERLSIMREAGGEVLVVALDISPERSAWASRTRDASCPTLKDHGWQRLSSLIEKVSGRVSRERKLSAFHPHGGTYIENPDETARLVDVLRQTEMGLCLDVGHYQLGGGDPIEAIHTYADVVNHVHLKDVDPDVLARLRGGQVDDLKEALRQRVFPELGSGDLDFIGVLKALELENYTGWLMIEQDTTWLRPSESSAVGLHLTKFGIRHLARSPGRK